MSTTEPPVPPVPTEYDKVQDLRLNKLEADVKKLTETPPPPVGPTKPTEEGVVKSDRADTNPHNWKSTSMVDRDKKGKWKIVDKKQRRVRTDLSSQAIADQWIAYETHVFDGGIVNPPPVDPGNPPVTPPPITPTGEKDQFGILKIAPDKAGGKTFTNFELEEKERNYASGAPSEWSCEYTADLGEKLSDIEVTYYIKINGFKSETDNVSTKVLGPSHQDGDGRSWYISEVQTDGSDKETLKTETPHPVYFNNKQPAKFQIGQSLVGNWIGIKVITYLVNGGKDRYLATYLDTPVTDINNPPNNWREYWSVIDSGQLDHAHFITPTGSLVTSRIDGIKQGDAPTFKFASVREVVAPTGGTTPPITPPPVNPPPVDPDNPPVDPGTPPVVSGDVDKFGVKSIYPSTGFRVYDYILKPNAGLRHNFDAIKSPTSSTEVTGYFSIGSAPDDEVSGKWSVTTHSDGNHVKCLDIGVGNKNGAARYRYEDPHPNYTGTLATGSKNGLPLESKFHGYKFIRLTMPDGTVQLEVWQDQGDNEGAKPANQWVQLAKWKVDKQYSVVDYPNGVYAVLRLDGDNIEKDLKQKWLSYVEVKAPTS